MKPLSKISLPPLPREGDTGGGLPNIKGVRSSNLMRCAVLHNCTEYYERGYILKCFRQHCLDKADVFRQPYQDSGATDPSFQPVENRVGSEHQRKYRHADTGTENIQDTAEQSEQDSLFPDFLDDFSGQ